MDLCDYYAVCGAYSTCNVRKVIVCQCLEKFTPRSPEDWDATDWSSGCEREVPLNRTKGEGFMKLTGVKLPDTTGASVNMSMNLKECREESFNNCLCTAYAKRYPREDGSGCIMWFSDLVDMRLLFNDAESDIYIRMAESALDSVDNSDTWKTVIKSVSATFSIEIVVLGLGSWGIRKTSPKVHSEKDTIESPSMIWVP